MRLFKVALLGVLAGVVVTLVTLNVLAFVARVNNIEHYLETHPIPTMVIPGLEEIPQSHKESHKGELSKPQQWKV
jgi:hypothetical protein